MVLPSLRVVGIVERQAHAAAVIGHRMVEGAMAPCPVWDDLESFDGRQFSGLVDLVLAGIPCQGNSVAGRQLGTDDERWLWGELWRVVRECGARWLFLENVHGIYTAPGDPLGEILETLAASGWAAEWDSVPAGTVGAPHLRDRFFLLATDANRVSVRFEPERDQRDRRGERTAERPAPEPRLGGAPRDVADALGVGRDEGRALEPGAIGQGGTDAPRSDPDGAGAPANTDGDGRARRRDRRQLDKGKRKARGRDVDGRRGAGDRHAEPLRPECAAIVAAGRAYWELGRAPEPVIRGVDDGLAAGLDPDAGIDGESGKPLAHADEILLLGNGVVPHAAAFALCVTWDRLHGWPITDRGEGADVPGGDPGCAGDDRGGGDHDRREGVAARDDGGTCGE